MMSAKMGQDPTNLKLDELFHEKKHASLVTHSCSNQSQVCVSQRGVNLGGPGTTALGMV